MMVATTKNESKRTRSKSKSNKGKESKSSSNKKQDQPETKDQNSNVDEDGIKKKLTNTAIFRKVPLREDDHLWWGLNSKYDDKWCGDLVPFQLPLLPVDPMKSKGGAFQRKHDVKPYEIQGREETSAYAWGDGGEGRIGSGFGVTDRVVPTLVNKLTEPPALVSHAFTQTSKSQLKLKDGAAITTVNQESTSLIAPVNPSNNNNAATKVEVNSRHGAGRIIDIAAGSRHSLCVTEDGVVYAWGDGHMGQLGSRKVCISLHGWVWCAYFLVFFFLKFFDSVCCVCP
jgi:hypothetical protein